MMYKQITQKEFIADMGDYGIDYATAQSMWQYMMSNYDVENYNAETIAKKFQSFDINYIKTKYDEELRDESLCFEGFDYDKMGDKEILHLFEMMMGYNIVSIDAAAGKVLFDVAYYGREEY